jgi:hypothetical protein
VNSIRGVFDEQTRRKPPVFAADAVKGSHFFVYATALLRPTTHIPA